MSTGRRGGRGGGERGGRGARGGTPSSGSFRGGSGRGNGNHPIAQTRASASKHDAPRGGAPRGAQDGRNTFRGRGSPKTNPFAGATKITADSNFKSTDPMNSTPFAAHEYQKRLEYLRERRPALKTELINKGLMDREGQINLSERVEKYGLCTDMCSEFERVRRIVEMDVKAPECTPETARKKRNERVPDESRMVKAHTRSAAGTEEELLTDVRTPDTCLRTLKYLWNRLDAEGLDFLYAFLWDRTRSIRKDLGLNKIRDGELGTYLQCVEQCARFHLLTLHQMAQGVSAGYSPQTDRGNDIEQLKNCMTSLRFYYKTVYEVNVNFPNRAEFLAYDLILGFAWGERMAPETRKALEEKYKSDRRVLTALAVIGAGATATSYKKETLVAKQQNYVEFWRLIKSHSVSYLMACAAELGFKSVRHHALRTLRKAYKPANLRAGRPTDDWTTTALMEPLGFDNTEQVREFCEAYGFSFTTKPDGEEYLDLNSLADDSSLQEQPAGLRDQYYSETFVESKRYGRTYSAIIQGMSIKEARTKGLLESVLETNSEDVSQETHGLFVPQEPSGVSEKKFVFGPIASGPAVNGTVNGLQNQNGTGAGAEKPAFNPFAAPFKPATPAATTSTAITTKPNPFLSATQSSPATPAALSNIQPGLFDPSKHSIRFTPGSTPQSSLFAPAITTSPFTVASTSTAPSLFKATTSAVPATKSPLTTLSSAMGSTPTAPQPWSFPSIAKPDHTVAPAASSAPGTFATSTQSTPGFNFASPTPPPSVVTEQEEQQRKAQEQQRIAEEQRRAREEQERQAAEQRRIAAEQERQRQLLLQEEQRKARAAELQRQEELALQQRQAELEEARKMEEERARSLDALSTTVLMDPDHGLLSQYLDNVIMRMARETWTRLQEHWMDELAEKRYQQRRLALARAACAKWIQQVEKKKQKAAVRRRREELRAFRAEHRAKAAEELPNSIRPEQQDKQTDENSFKKPEIPPRKDAAPKSKSAKETQRNECSRPPVHAVARQAKATGKESMRKLTANPEIMNVSTHSVTSSTTNGNYSDEYYKSKAPTDRTQTDWFEIRAMGLDPAKYRKRSFGSVSSDDETETAVESKRARRSTSSSFRRSLPPPLPPPKSDEELAARLHAVRMANRTSGSRRSSISSRPLNDSTAALIQKARDLIGDTTTPRHSPPAVHHQHSRSVPGLRSSMLPGPSTLGHHTGATPLNEPPAFWYRNSRFVPRHLYGKGADAVRAYREEMFGKSTPQKAPLDKTPLNLSSPMPNQLSYVPTGETQHEYEESPEHVDGDDADGEDDEEEAEGEEDENEEDDEEDDGDSLEDYGHGMEEKFSHDVFEEYESEEEDEESDEGASDEEDPQQFAQRPGGTQDDAIELSD